MADPEDRDLGSPGAGDGDDELDGQDAGSPGQDGEGGEEETLQERVARLEEQLNHERRAKRLAQGHTVKLQRRLDEVAGGLDELQQERAEEAERGQARRLQDAQARVAAADTDLRTAYEGGDNEAIVKAQKAHTQAVFDERRLTDELETQKSRKARQPRSEEEPEPTTRKPAAARQPQVPQAFQDWHAKNSWYNSRKNDDDVDDSTVAYNVMNRVAQETGLQPDDPEFFDEVDARLKAKMPRRYGNGGGNGTRRSGARVAGGGRSSAGGGGEDQALFRDLPPALVQSFTAAGKDLSDPKVKARAIKYANETAEAMGLRRN
jgi:hypothetical protein